MYQMIRACRPNLTQAWRVLAARVGQHVLSVFKAQNLVLLRRYKPTHDGGDLRCDGVSLLGCQWSDAGPSKDGPISTGDTRLDEVTRPGKGGHGRCITIFVGFAPGDQAMFGQDDQPGMRPGTERQSHLAGQAKAGASVRDPNQLVTKAIPSQLLATLGTGEVIRRVGVGMIDMRKRQKPVQEGLDGGTRTTRLVETMRQVVHHLGIAHALAFYQGKDIVQKQPGK